MNDKAAKPVTYDELLALLLRYLDEQPTEGGRYDSWRDRVDMLLSLLRSDLSVAKDGDHD